MRGIIIQPPGPANAIQQTHYYFSCPECGWCSTPSTSYLLAVHEGRQHKAVKAATRDEQR